MRGKRHFLWLFVAMTAVGAGCRQTVPPQRPDTSAQAEAPVLASQVEPASEVTPDADLNRDRPLADVIAEHRAQRGAEYPGTLGVLVKKEMRRLWVTLDNEPIKAYQIALGREPEGTKTQRGDGRTPEGQYYLWGKNPRSRFYLSLGVSYPGPEDAERGERAGLISPRLRERIELASRSRTRPPQDTPLGGNIMIHGGGVTRVRRQPTGERLEVPRDWTAGCIAVRNEDMDELFRQLPAGVSVNIQP